MKPTAKTKQNDRLKELQKLLDQKNRELKIEAALEKVRSRAMAMRNSNELIEVANTLREQMRLLSQPELESIFIILYDEKNYTEEEWFAFRPPEARRKRILTGSFKWRLDENEVVKKLFKIYKSRKRESTFDVKGQELKELLEQVKVKLPDLIEYWDEELPENIIHHVTRFSGGLLLMTSYDAPTEKSKDLQRRITKTFDMAFKRFLDLKKAEAQAREAQIEAALEKVRARAMAMQSSEELNTLIGHISTELSKLDMVLTRTTLFVIEPDKKSTRWWMANSEAPSEPMNFLVPYHNHPPYREWLKAWKNREQKWIYHLKGKVKKEWDEFIFSETELSQLPDIVIQGMMEPDHVILTASCANFGCLMPASLEPLSEEQIDILIRFTNVFDQTYTRFLDLQKAEEQVREAEIQLALERVRAKTMAMHSSDELGQASAVLFQQLEALGFHSWFCGFALLDRTKNESEYRVANANNFLSPIFIPNTTDPATKHMYEHWVGGDEYYMEEAGGQQLIDHYNYLLSLPKSGHVFQSVLDSGHEFPSWQQWHAAYFSQGYIMIITVEPYNNDGLLQRFATVFQQTYTRFLDLQKAEAQARESQIEAALERVRSGSLAMHHTSELQEVINTVHQQFRNLNIADTGGAFIAINEKVEDGNDFFCWGAGGMADYIQQLRMPLLDRPILKNLVQRIKDGPGFFTEEFTDLEKMELFKHMFKFPPLNTSSSEHKKEVMSRKGGYARSCIVSKYTSIFIINHHGQKFSDADNEILNRFGKVFEQSYTRFLDLKKAESQAREAQIEAALERVRASALAMHTSEDLVKVAGTLREQMSSLGQPLLEGAVIELYDLHEDYIESWHTFVPAAKKDGAKVSGKELFRKDGCTLLEDLVRMYKSPQKEYTIVSKGKKQKDFVRILSEQIPEVAKVKMADVMYYTCSDFTGGTLVVGTLEEPSIETKELLSRASKVFDLAYKRFLDLKKAEAQAREAQIEAALERVRSRSIAMRRSEEIADIAGKIFGELRQLDLALNRVLIWTFNDTEKYTTWWSSNPEVESTAESYRIDYNDNPVFINYLQAWQQRKPIYLFTLSGDTKKSWEDHLFKHTEMSRLPMAVRKGMRAEGTLFTISVISDYGLMMSGSFEPLSDANIDIIQRFGRVFQQSYTRYLDVQKAEAQAREAEIQLALERVRARTMAMHKSDELSDTASVMFQELKKLGINSIRTGVCIFDFDQDTAELWLATEDGNKTETKVLGKVSGDMHPMYRQWIDAGAKKKNLFQYKISGKELSNYYDIASAHLNLPELPGYNKSEIYYGFFFSGGSINVIATDPLTEEELDIGARFANVFGLLYRRFLDLQKAEAQAREAQIEAALEKVRSRSLAMHQAEELGEVAAVVFEKLRELNIPVNDGVAIVTHIEGSKDQIEWMESPDYTTALKVNLPYFDHPVLSDYWKAKNEGLDFIAPRYTAEENKSFLNHIFKYTDYRHTPQEIKDSCLAAKTYSYSAAFQKNSSIFINDYTGRSLSEHEIEIVKRFSIVFEQAYVRFLDLQKAEAQAREAQIEAALERVRAKAMGMHSSNDLSITASLVFTELRKLGVNSIRSGVGLFNKESRKVQLYSAIPSATGDSLSLVGWVQLEKHPVLEKIYETWLKQEDYFPEMQGEELRSYYQSLLTGLSVPMPEFKNDEKQFGHFITSSIGCLYAWSKEDFNGDQLKIFRRFASIIDLTFRRYLELQKAEAQALEAVKQASLDRVRAEIASMRTADDLNRITPLIWRELTTLGVPFFRCGVFIVDDEAKKIDSYLSNPEGESLAAWRSDYDTIPLFKASVNAWKQQQVYLTEWDKNQFIEFSRILVDQGLVRDVQRYQAGMNAPDYLSLQMIPFKQGMLYVGSAEKLKEDQIKLVQTLASAFSIAYSRYEDFRQLEKAKSEVEQTLTELKSTQTQLIHSEKMASLGELTAGIAHEIQNPLNFVNNFSEVSEELIEELIEELRNGDLDEARAISNDVIENLRKINHHGQRASSIVKGMLEHSRSGTNKKELTDINRLADEYLRLAYHGLRAKDKTFQAEFKTDLDSALPKIKLIGQEIGRVLLNLINNAFYAVSEKSKRARNDYVPTVIIQTKRQGNIVEIRVKDNADGIPAIVIDKIFQPFFTTKPSGHGTGLGLSLSYDIITKGHDGHLEVDTQEGIGTEFIIRIPII